MLESVGVCAEGSTAMLESLCRLVTTGAWGVDTTGSPGILWVELPTVPVVLSSVLGLPFPNMGKLELKSMAILEALL